MWYPFESIYSNNKMSLQDNSYEDLQRRKSSNILYEMRREVKGKTSNEKGLDQSSMACPRNSAARQ